MFINLQFPVLISLAYCKYFPIINFTNKYNILFIYIYSRSTTFSKFRD